MTKIIDFIFDFGSPNAYMAWKVLPDVAAKNGAEINYCPALLGGIFKSTNNQAPWQAYGGVKGKFDYERLELTRFIAKHKLTAFKFNPHFPVNTLLMMRGAMVAQNDGVLESYITAGMTAMWEEGLNMSQPNVFADVMTTAGLDGPVIAAETQNPEVKLQLINETADAVARGVFGIPSFFVGGEMFFGKDRIRDLEDCL